MAKLINSLRGGLIVSCQARDDSPLRDSHIMAAFARAAALGGAVAIRASGPQDIAAIRAAVDLPIFGIYKQDLPGTDVIITPTFESGAEVVAAGSAILTIDATARPRPGGVSAAALITRCRLELGVPVMADVSTVEEGIAAADAGADLVATTLSGYTPYSPQQSGPDFELIAALAARVSVPIVAEGRIATPEDARRAREAGAHAVVVGAAITRPEWITRRFFEVLRGVAASAAHEEEALFRA